MFFFWWDFFRALVQHLIEFFIFPNHFSPSGFQAFGFSPSNVRVHQNILFWSPVRRFDSSQFLLWIYQWRCVKSLSPECQLPFTSLSMSIGVINCNQDIRQLWLLILLPMNPYDMMITFFHLKKPFWGIFLEEVCLFVCFKLQLRENVKETSILIKSFMEAAQCLCLRIWNLNNLPWHSNLKAALSSTCGRFMHSNFFNHVILIINRADMTQ